MRLSALGRVVRGQHHHRQILVDQRVGPVLHFAGGIAFGVDVGDLLQLERAFERDREMNAAAEEQEVGGAEQFARQLFVDADRADSTVSSLPGMRSSSCTRQRDALSSRHAVGLAQVHRQDEQRGQLAGERLGGGHADLRPGVRDRWCPAASRVIMEPTTLQMASVLEPFCLASRCAASVSAVSPDCEITTVSVSAADDGIAIAELAAVIHFHRNARQLLDHELAGQRGVPAGAAGDDLAPGGSARTRRA